MTQTANPRLMTVRRDERQAERIVAALFPLDTGREVALRILADSIACAARVAPASWGTSLFHQRICLNVGRGAVLQLYPEGIVFIVTGALFNTLPAAVRRVFRINRTYKFIPDALEGRLSATHLSHYGSFRQAHIDLIERAATGRKVCLWPYSHSSSIVDLLRKRGYSVPTPDYPTASGPTIIGSHLPASGLQLRRTFLFAWNPARREPPSLSKEIRQLERAGSVIIGWRSGRRRDLPVGSRVFMIRLGVEPRGIIGAGWSRTEPEGSPPGLDIEFEALQETPAIPLRRLQKPPFSYVTWSIQASGVELPTELAASLEAIWPGRGKNGGHADRVLLSDSCIYTIRHSDELRRTIAAGGNGTYSVGQNWTRGKEILEQARRESRHVPVVFAPAEKTSNLFAWALLNRIRVGRGTTYTFSGLHRLAGNFSKTSLLKVNNRKALSKNFIRPYAICLTPDYLHSEASEGRTVLAPLIATTDLDLAELDTHRSALARLEQDVFRRVVVGRSGIGVCQLCGREFPLNLLVAAHIKPRAKCNDDEKRDLANIFALCKLGCDDLFERGYLVVDEGSIKPGVHTEAATPAVREYVMGLSGRQCPGWSNARARYFSWRLRSVTSE